jgi:hypothetical protein
VQSVEFIEKRLADAQIQLSQAEGNLQAFLMENRDFRSSPNLSSSSTGLTERSIHVNHCITRLRPPTSRRRSKKCVTPRDNGA